MVQKNDRTLVDWEFYMQKASSNKKCLFLPKKDQNSTKDAQMQLFIQWKNVQNVRNVNFAQEETVKLYYNKCVECNILYICVTSITAIAFKLSQLINTYR